MRFGEFVECKRSNILINGSDAFKIVKRIMCFGTFDVLHAGHEYYLKQARKMGDWLVVVVALDETVVSVKGKRPKNGQSERLKRVRQLGMADEVMLGRRGDKLAVVEQVKPEVLALGYDQKAFTQNIRQRLKDRGLKTEIVRIKAFHPDKYKSALLKKNV